MSSAAPAEIQAAAEDQEDKHRRIHAERALRSWTGPDGAWKMSASGTPDAGARFMARIQPRAVPDTTEFSSANSGLAEPVYEPSGFLGLSDEPVFARHPPQPAPPEHKKWWQRLRAS